MRFAALISCLISFTCRSEVIDRIAVSVENSVISESEIIRQIRLTAFLNDEPIEITPEKKRETAERLVEQMLVRREITTTRYSAPDPDAYLKLYEALRKHIGDESAYKPRLEKYGVTDADVRDALRWQTTFLDFVQVRFRPGVQVPDNEISLYYDAEVATKPNAPSLEDAREDIESLLTEQRVNAAIDRWMGQSRTQTQIRYREEVFR